MRPNKKKTLKPGADYVVNYKCPLKKGCAVFQMYGSCRKGCELLKKLKLGVKGVNNEK